MMIVPVGGVQGREYVYDVKTDLIRISRFGLFERDLAQAFCKC